MGSSSLSDPAKKAAMVGQISADLSKLDLYLFTITVLQILLHFIIPFS